MELSKKILSDIIIFQKYAKYLPELERRESWNEIVDRNKQMHIEKFPSLTEDINKAYDLVKQKKVLPSMRSIQFAGKPIKINNSRMFNCSFSAVDDYRVFNEAMFLLLSGCGFGYSVQRHHVEKLPAIVKPLQNRRRRFVIEDSIIGWAEAIKALMKSYLGFTNSNIEFDFSEIRPKGAMLVTSGGKAPGPQPLKECLIRIKGVLDNKQNGEKLTPIETHSIMCYIADSVLSGGIRRAAMISLFSFDDDEMLNCKTGNWWETNPHFGRANNSVVLVRSRIKKEEFDKLWLRIKASGSGEPGIYWTNNPEIGINPCAEISLKSNQFCNLTTINASYIESEEDLKQRVWAATFIGTLQASYTDYNYLRDIWKYNSEKDALLGVSMTGVASMEVFNYDLAKMAEYAKEVNRDVAAIIGINPAARVTCLKPEGTSSLVCGTSSGIHAWHNDYYFRRVRVNKNESIYTYLSIYSPELLEDDFFKPNDTAIMVFPQKAPVGAVTRSESALQLLERVKYVTNSWVRNGYNSGYNHNNVSCTVSIKDNEWDDVKEWMWENREIYSGLSVLPFSDHTYIQAPFEDCTAEQYEEFAARLHEVDVTNVVEINDTTTNRKDELSCGANGCEVV